MDLRRMRWAVSFIGTSGQPRTRFRRRSFAGRADTPLVEAPVVLRQATRQSFTSCLGEYHMRRLLFAALLTATASAAVAASTPKEQLMKPPAGARHYTISSTAGKHGDIWSWTTPQGQAAYRMSMSLR